MAGAANPRLDGTRARIVAAGVALLDDQGVEAVGLRAIARAAGVSHGAPRRYFATHAALLAAIARTGLEDLGDAVSPPLTAADEPPDERLIAAGRAYIGFAGNRRAMFELMFRHDLLDGAGGDLRELSIPLLRDVHEAVADAIDDESTWNRALRLWTSIHGLAVLVANRTLEPVEALAAVDIDQLIADIVGAALR